MKGQNQLIETRTQSISDLLLADNVIVQYFVQSVFGIFP